MICSSSHAGACLDHRSRKVLDVDKIAPSRGHDAAFALGQALEKDRQRPRDVARSNHVSEPESHVVEPRQREIVLRSGLRNGIRGIPRIFRVVQPDRRLQRFHAVAQGGLKVDESSHAVLLRGADKICRADDIRHRVRVPVQRILIRGGGVNDDLGTEIAD